MYRLDNYWCQVRSNSYAFVTILNYVRHHRSLDLNDSGGLLTIPTTTDPLWIAANGKRDMYKKATTQFLAHDIGN